MVASPFGCQQNKFLNKKMKLNTCTCIDENFQHPGKTIKEIKSIYKNLEQIKENRKSWSSKIQCRICSRIWEEKYVQRGHGEAPEVEKIQKSS